MQLIRSIGQFFNEMKRFSYGNDTNNDTSILCLIASFFLLIFFARKLSIVRGTITIFIDLKKCYQRYSDESTYCYTTNGLTDGQTERRTEYKPKVPFGFAGRGLKRCLKKLLMDNRHRAITLTHLEH